MSEENKSQGSGRKRRRRRRRRGKKSGGGGGSNNSGKRKSNRRRRSGRRKNSGNRRSGRSGSNKRRTKREKFGGREPVAEFERRTGPVAMTPFELFVNYYMGVTDDNRYSKPSMGQTARRFGVEPEDIEQALRACGMDKHTLRDVDFDMSLAQLDIRVAPEGIDKREIAKTLFEEFVEINPHFVDLDEDEIAREIDLDDDSEEE